MTDAVIEWAAARLVLVRSTDAPAPRWPPSPACLRALEEGRSLDALKSPDDVRARFVLLGYLAGDVPHLLLARDQQLEREVVIKLIVAPTWAAQIRAAKEARLTAKLSHPHVVEVYEVDPDGAYVVLERLDGDLRELHGEDPELLLDAYCQAGRGLAAAHACGIWHLDVKPDNVLVHLERDGDGRARSVWAKIGDFGLASSPTPGLLPRGTPGYEAPERGRDLGIDGALADQYSFALSVRESLGSARRLCDRSWTPPHGLDAVLDRALAVDPRRRWPDMTQLVDAIEDRRRPPRRRTSPMPRGGRLLAQALAQAEDGLCASACCSWTEAEASLAGRLDELGHGGLALGRALLSWAETVDGLARERGYAAGLVVLEAALRYLCGCGELAAAGEAKRLAIEGCGRWLEAHGPGSAFHRDLRRLDRALRRLSLLELGDAKARRIQPGSGPVGAAREAEPGHPAWAAQKHCPATKTPPLWPFGELHGPMEATSWRSPATGGLTLQPLEVADVRGRASTAARSARSSAPVVRSERAPISVDPSTPQPKPSKLES